MAGDMKSELSKALAESPRPGGLPPAWSPSAAGPPDRVFTVRPASMGWCVRGEGVEGLFFRRGSDAEHQARALAEACARLGHDTRVTVYDRGGRLAGAIDYFGATATPASAARTYPWSH